MRTIGFYSFRGGVGRSNLVLNVAFHLARLGHHVGILDLDLEAPGLTLSPALDPAPDVTVPDQGLVDFLDAATRVLIADADAAEDAKDRETSADDTHGSDADDAPELPTVPRLDQLIYETQISTDKVGSVHLVPTVAKNATLSDHHRAGRIYAALTRERRGDIIGAQVFRYLREQLEAHRVPRAQGDPQPLDFLLVDLRTGITELSDTAVGALVDELIIVSGLTTQHIDGLYASLDAFAKGVEAHRDDTVQARLVISPVPTAELDRVRARLAALHRDLTARAVQHGWLEPDRRFQLLLPPAATPRSDRPGFEVVHYCDYLAVGDGIILDEYPETLAARELHQIAERINGDPEVLAQQTHTALRETGLLARQRVTEHERPAWRWQTEYWRRPPSWRWPLAAFAREGFDADAFAAELTSSIEDPAEAEALFDGLGASVSLDEAEKLKIIESLPKLSAAQRQSLIAIFEEERTKFGALDTAPPAELGALIAQHLRTWIAVLAQCGATWVSPAERTARIARGDCAIDPVPPWALLDACARSDDPEVAHEAASALLALPDAPVVPIARLLDALPPEPRDVLRADVAAWAERADFTGAAPEWLQALGQMLSSRFGAHATAERIHRMARDADPQAIAPLVSLGNLYQDHLARPADAEDAYRRAIALDDTKAIPWNNLGNLLKGHLGRYEEAEVAYRRAIELDETYASPWNGLGNLLADHLGWYEEAEKAYRRAIELDETDAYPWYGLGYLLADHLGRYEEAETAYRHTIELDGTYASPWNGLGSLLADHLGRYEEAEKAYERAIELDESNASPWNNLGNLLADHLGRYDEAEAAYRRAIELAGATGSAVYGHYNYFRLLHFGRVDATRAPEQFAALQTWLAEAGRAIPLAKRDDMYLTAMALADVTLDLRETYDSRLARPLTGEDRAWLHIVAAARPELPDGPPLPDPEASPLTADECESTTVVLAMFAPHIDPPTLARLTDWLRALLTHFSPPPGSRDIHPPAIEPYLAALGLSWPMTEGDP